MSAYYNEIDPFCCEWIKNLMREGLIADGEIDTRPIQEVQPEDVSGFVRCHWFAGIAGWDLALRYAGWDDARPVWTGSCPCQPFSAAGKGKGTADERHLWPEFYRLIRECRPAIAFGEQVASAAGRSWLSGVFADLEEVGYAVAGADLCAAGIGAPHIRQRLWWVAHAEHHGPHTEERLTPKQDSDGSNRRLSGGSSNSGVAHARHDECMRRDAVRYSATANDGTPPAHEGSGSRGQDEAGQREIDESPVRSPSSGVDDTNSQRRRQRIARREDAVDVASPSEAGWGGIYIPCADGRARRIEPGIEPLVNGLPGRVGRLRAYGNAIVPQVAAEFIGAVMECRP